MTICLIGKNLTTLVLSKILINEGIKVDLYILIIKYQRGV